MANILKLLSYNVNGIASPGKCSAIVDKFIYLRDKCERPQVIFFQETRLAQKNAVKSVKHALANYETFFVHSVSPDTGVGRGWSAHGNT